MPKKFRGENTKAAEARARKNAQKQENDARKKKQEEDEYWKDDDKHAVKKEQRKLERERKKLEVQERKLESKQIQEEEEKQLSQSRAAAAKLTQAEIHAQRERERLQKEREDEIKALAAKRIVVIDDEAPIEENINRLQIDGEQASTVDQAIRVLDDKVDKVDRHPEKRLRAAYLAFEEERMETLKRQNPSLRLTQLKQMLRKEWTKSPQNPLNEKLLNQ